MSRQCFLLSCGGFARGFLGFFRVFSVESMESSFSRERAAPFSEKTRFFAGKTRFFAEKMRFFAEKRREKRENASLSLGRSPARSLTIRPGR